MPDASLAPVASRAMTWEDYENLGDEVRGQYIDGQLVLSPSPTRQHQQICQRLVTVLSSAVPAGHEVTAGWAWKPGQDEFVPDVMVHPTTTESTRFTGTPALIVEVLSTNRGDDLVVKTTKYAAAGLVHYWGRRSARWRPRHFRAGGNDLPTRRDCVGGSSGSGLRRCHGRGRSQGAARLSRLGHRAR